LENVRSPRASSFASPSSAKLVAGAANTQDAAAIKATSRARMHIENLNIQKNRIPWTLETSRNLQQSRQSHHRPRRQPVQDGETLFLDETGDFSMKQAIDQVRKDRAYRFNGLDGIDDV
jgi:hypothetical protein